MDTSSALLFELMLCIEPRLLDVNKLVILVMSDVYNGLRGITNSTECGCMFYVYSKQINFADYNTELQWHVM